MNYFRHYKGKYYRMLSEARHSETLEEMVVYQALYGEQTVWVRPKAMFFENVSLADGSVVRRFAPCSEAEALASVAPAPDPAIAVLTDVLFAEFKDKGYVAEDFSGGCSLCGEANEFLLDAICVKITQSLPNVPSESVDNVANDIYTELHRRFEAEEQ